MSRSDRPLQFIKGVGPKRADVLAEAGLQTPVDILYAIPYQYVDRNAAASIATLYEKLRADDLWSGSAQAIASANSEVSLMATVTHVETRSVGKSKKMFTALITDSSGARAQLVFWNYVQHFERTIRIGDTYLVSGIAEYDAQRNIIRFTHPELDKIGEDDAERVLQGSILPKYRLSQKLKSAGITMRLMRSIAEQVIEKALLTEVDPFPDVFRHKYNLQPLKAALRALHFPTSHSEIEDARYRMKFEELFFFELILATRQRNRKSSGRGIQMNVKSPRARDLVDKLPYHLTSAQKRVVNEIMRDISSGEPMNRLLQGDVGSGKTIVALLCMLSVVDNGYQALIMAPTEILADQHFRTIRSLLRDSGVNIELMVGGQKRKLRREILSRISSGETHIIAGTHALFESEIEYHKLGLAVIDEQHRFGVAQRAELKRLGSDSHFEPHFLVMSATPIPRTLSMTLYGDLDVSVIDVLPDNRHPIQTQVVYSSQIESVYKKIRTEVQQGRQGYIVYPLVEKSDKLAFKSAVEHYKMLSEQVFPDLRVGLLHGQMFWYEKDDIMKSFLQKGLDILVATTVVEVGVDIPNATVMLIEDAERFGLSQLHQLRGRVGRSVYQSYCYLATKDHFQYAVSNAHAAAERANAAVRLRTMEETNDGFRIAEVDLQIRGPGDLMGTRQSGLPKFRYADLVTDGPIVTAARKEAFATLEADPHLRKEEHGLIRDRLIRDFNQKSYITVA